MLQRVGLCAGSQLGGCPAYERAARALGEELARRGVGLVYAGAESGLMAVVAETVRARGGEVVGVLAPAERPCGGTAGPPTHQDETDSARECVRRMIALADGIVVLPGGCGTFAELFLLLFGNQFGVRAKPLGLLNVGGYFAPLLLLLAQIQREGFTAHGGIRGAFAAQDAPALLDSLATAASGRPADDKESVS